MSPIHEPAHAVVAAARPFYVQEGEPVMRLRWVELASSAVPRNGQVLSAGLCSVSYESGTN
ncbi:hypothetical protein AB0I98_47450 [Streptomyces sp. NPDC050211]|uniref:hypothetical protein n=1 Tax=Streptomyces sp. NPDC050211 TaxID=3154932 RepID=UPI00344251A3